MALLEIINISKSFRGDPALDNVNLQLEQGGILGLLGPSGCGKTTLLRIIAGLETADSGMISCEGKDMAAVPSHLRNFGMMFQDFALFPHRDVFENVAFGLQIQKLAARTILERTLAVLRLVGMEAFARRNVSELSGGERQRVALARSLAPQPRLLMLDEPLGSLDRTLRERLMRDLKRILKKVGVTAIFVTHDQTEAFAVADEIAVMQAGQVLQVGCSENLFRNPASIAVARFLGFQNLVAGRVLAPDRIDTPLGIISHPTHSLPVGAQVTVLIRPEAASVPGKYVSEAPGAIRIRGELKDRLFRGRHYHLGLEVIPSGELLAFDLTADENLPAVGEPIDLLLSPASIQVLAE